jgi:hypothetical protein
LILALITDSFKQYLDGPFAKLRSGYYRPVGLPGDGLRRCRTRSWHASRSGWNTGRRILVKVLQGGN